MQRIIFCVPDISLPPETTLKYLNILTILIVLYSMHNLFLSFIFLIMPYLSISSYEKKCKQSIPQLLSPIKFFLFQ
jgi:hypothetical protein